MKHHRLLRRSQLFTGEWLGSLLDRLASRNSYSPAILEWLVLSQANEEQPLIDDINCPVHTETFRRLNTLTQIDAASLYHATAHRFAPALTSPDLHPLTLDLPDGRKLPCLLRRAAGHQVGGTSAVQFCPICLQAGAYYRLIWQPVAVSACIAHRCLLVQHCFQCHRSVDIHDVTQAQCSGCGADLKTSPIQSLEHDETGLMAQQVIQHWLLPDSPVAMHDVSGLPQQSPSALYRVLDGLRIVTMFVEAGWDYLHTAALDVSSAFPFQNAHLRQISAEQRYCLYSTAFKGLQNWPAGFYDFLDAYRDRGNRKDTRGIYADLGVLYASWIAQYWQHPAFQFVQDAFDAYLLTHRSLTHSVIRADRYRANPELAQRFAYITIAEAARLMGTTQKLIHRLIDSGRLTGYHAEDNPRYILLYRSDILELREHWSNALELADTAQRSGISEEVVVDLVKAGLLIAEQCPAEGFKRWLFTQAAVEQCLETIRSHAHLVSEQDNVQALGLATAARMLAGIGLNAAGVLRYVLQGRLPAYYTGDEEHFSLQSLVFLACDIHSLGEHIKTERGWMGRDDVARYLGIKDTTLKRRVESGLIVPVAVVAGAQYFDRECIEEFVESYVTTDEAAEILGIKPLTVQSWARQGRLPAVTGPDIDGGHAYYFEKQTLVMWRYERLTSGEAQALLNVSKATLHRWVTLGKLTPLQDMGGTQRWFARQDVAKLSRR